MGNSTGGRRRGGIIGIVVVGAYLVLRFGLIAWREHEEGMSTGQIVLTLLVIAVAAFALIELVWAGYHAQTRRREAALAAMHPGAHLVPVQMKKDLSREIEHAAGVLGHSLTRDVPRRGLATVVADGHGIGIYAGGREPWLVLGIPRQAIAAVANGETTAAGRYAFGKVDALRVVVAPATAVDLPVYRTVVGFPKTLRGDELEARVRTVALAAGVQVMPTAGPAR